MFLVSRCGTGFYFGLLEQQVCWLAEARGLAVSDVVYLPESAVDENDNWRVRGGPAAPWS